MRAGSVLGLWLPLVAEAASSVVFKDGLNTARISATCDASETPVVTSLHPLHFAAWPSAANITVQLGGVAPSCASSVGLRVPCATQTDRIPPLWYCVWKADSGEQIKYAAGETQQAMGLPVPG